MIKRIYWELEIAKRDGLDVYGVPCLRGTGEHVTCQPTDARFYGSKVWSAEDGRLFVCETLAHSKYFVQI